MKYLLDTHILLWYLTNDSHLDLNIKELINYYKNTTFISSVFLWEITIKYSKGKIFFEGFTLNDLLSITEQTFSTLFIDNNCLLELLNTNKEHKDPFDNMLVAQAISNGMKLITIDKDLTRLYPSLVFTQPLLTK